MDKKIITLGTYSFSQAQLLKARLESEKIDCYLKNINLIQSAIGTGVKVKINEENLSKALDIIDKLELTYASDTVQLPTAIDNININRILVPIDFSDFSPQICDYAEDIARKFNADILLFHTYSVATIDTVPLSENYAYNSTLMELIADMEEHSKNKLQVLADTIKDNLQADNIDGVEVTCDVSGGTPAVEILNRYDSYQPDLLIMGSRGETAGTSNLLGSVVADVIEEVKVPVLIISDQGKHINFEETQNIMYATNFDKSDIRAIAKLQHISKPYGVDIKCVHFEKNKADNTVTVHKMGLLRRYISRLLDDTHITCDIITNKNTENAIEKYVEENNIQAIAIMAHKHSLLQRLFFGNTSRSLFIKTHIPIFFFHE